MVSIFMKDIQWQHVSPHCRWIFTWTYAFYNYLAFSINFVDFIPLAICLSKYLTIKNKLPFPAKAFVENVLKQSVDSNLIDDGVFYTDFSENFKKLSDISWVSGHNFGKQVLFVEKRLVLLYQRLNKPFKLSYSFATFLKVAVAMLNEPDNNLFKQWFVAMCDKAFEISYTPAQDFAKIVNNNTYGT